MSLNAIMTVLALLSRFFVGRCQIHGFNEVARLIIYCIFAAGRLTTMKMATFEPT